MPAVIGTASAMRAWADEQHAAGRRIALVPTMGYLHDGHLSLVAEARRRGDAVAVSIFVNPTQFGPKEDLARYPRDLAGDLRKLEDADLVFTPSPEVVYPPGFATYVVPTAMAEVLCGRARPGHFRGVCTVVAILLRLTRCHVAVFGQKDFQQLQIVRRMVRDLWLDVEVVGMPIVREPDGLAMSSRNVYLSPEHRRDALALSRAVRAVEEAAAAGERRAATLLERGRALLAATPAVEVEYLEIVARDTLGALDVLDREAACCVAARVGATRLIDNVLLA